MNLILENGTVIAESEFDFKASSSSGPGGQHVNKNQTRVTLFYDVGGSEHFSEQQKKRIKKKLASRIDKDGVLRVSSQKHRSQRANKEAAVEKLGDLLNKALKVQRRRKRTGVPKSQKAKRLDEKRKQSQKKELRKDVL